MICKKNYRTKIYWTILFGFWLMAVVTVWQTNREYDIAQNLYIATLKEQDVKNSRRWLVRDSNFQKTIGTSIASKTQLGAVPLQAGGVAWRKRIQEYPILVKIAFCESGMNPGVYSWDGGAEARGLFQITRRYWPDITDEQAFDPEWSLNWAIEKMEAGQLYLWTCWKNQLKNYQ